MRQNTKLISASDKDGAEDARKSKSTHSSPVKKGRPEPWTVEPWNGEMKLQSPRKRATGSGGSNGSAPPLPGHQSNAVAHTSIIDEEMRSEAATIDSGERGRLFVKVMGVKDLELPLPKSECRNGNCDALCAMLTINQTNALGSASHSTTVCIVSQLPGLSWPETRQLDKNSSWWCQTTSNFS